eukprot:NODE_279_length_1853_cov_268.353659_g226_i0.p1 GENE.NODE_279_length_1853_cov_268.353659_g226_i0~~NODE_279_length_1853_cov_268.353659_g226_i0.p1  ORF type:complete len:515 (-),score=139.72 NODE_279_length_1853_cov_268.353659_g226_i0:27-1571(-)
MGHFLSVYFFFAFFCLMRLFRRKDAHLVLVLFLLMLILLLLHHSFLHTLRPHRSGRPAGSLQQPATIPPPAVHHAVTIRPSSSAPASQLPPPSHLHFVDSKHRRSERSQRPHVILGPALAPAENPNEEEEEEQEEEQEGRDHSISTDVVAGQPPLSGPSSLEIITTTTTTTTITTITPTLEHDSDYSSASSSSDNRNAYVIMISNNKYVDGALVLGWSIAQHSLLVQQRRCDLLVMLTNAIADSNKRRLQEVGYHIVPINKSLSDTNRRSAWKDTLNKLYLFNLTDYHKIAFFDADMLAVANPDAIFNVRLPNSSWVGAVGYGKYFATGTMVLMPDAEVCRQIVKFYLDTAHNKSDKRGFMGYNARDGLVFRWFVKNRHVNLESGFSLYSTMAHFRGGWKPWYNRAWKGKEVAHLASILRGSVDTSGSQYHKWWAAYEAMHNKLWRDQPYIGGGDKNGGGGAGGGGGGVYGGKAVAPNGTLNGVVVSPRTHVWMNRFTIFEYVQLLEHHGGDVN